MSDNQGKPKQFSPEWWQNREISTSWCHRFCLPFFAQDRSLSENDDKFNTVGVVFFNTPKGENIPVGMVAIDNGNFLFQYHPTYLERQEMPPISVNLPKQKDRYCSLGKMPSFFDNLLAEGWFGKAQSSALGLESQELERQSLAERHHRLMMFGRDCPGAFWATYIRVDPRIEAEEQHQETVTMALQSRSTISGVQPKLLGVMDEQGLRPAGYWETSSHIIKLPGEKMPGMIEYEYMSHIATRALLPQDTTADMSLQDLIQRDGSRQEVLAIKRFDRTPEGGRVHFEEFNQLLDKASAQRYEGAYTDIADVLREKTGHDGVKQFYARLVTQFLLSNTDNHFKNFALFQDSNRLTPDYDLAPGANYNRKALALFKTKEEYEAHIRGIEKRSQLGESKGRPEERDTMAMLSSMDAKALVKLGQSFKLDIPEITDVISGIASRIKDAKKAVREETCSRLDKTLPIPQGREAWRTTKNYHVGGKGSDTSGFRPRGGFNQSYRDDFCDRLDSRANQLFGGIDKYLQFLGYKNRSDEAIYTRVQCQGVA